MAEPIKWLYFDLNSLKYIDDDDPVSYLQSNPDAVLIELSVDENNPLTSGIDLTPYRYPVLTRSDGILYELVVSGGNVSIVNEDTGDVLIESFLPTSGGTMTGDLYLNRDPEIDSQAATKHYVDQAISGSTVSGAVADAISSLLQVDFTIGTEMGGVVNNHLPLNNVTAVINGEDFSLGADRITIKEEGMYQISWNVVGQMTGTAATRRRNIVADLNMNNGTTFPAGSLGGTYTRDKGSSPIVNVGGDYIIETAAPNETVGVRTRDFSDETMNGLDFKTIGGYFRVRLVRKS